MTTASDHPADHRLWIVNHYADAPDRPSGTRHFDLARRLAAGGREVTIFAAGLNHQTGREERLGQGRLYRSQSFDGIRFVWLRTFRYRGNNWRRQLNMLSFVAVFLLVQLRFARPGAIIGSTVHPFAAGAAWLVARLRGAMFLFEIRDLWPQTLVDLGAMRDGSPGERGLRWLEAFLVRHAAVVITLLPGIGDYLRERRLPVAHLLYVPNGVDLDAFDAAARDPDRRDPAVGAVLAEVERMRADGRLVLGYLGTFGRVNRVDVVVRAALLAEERAPGRIGLVLVGDGPERAELEHLGGGTAAVAFAPPVPKRAVPAILVELDGAVVHATATPVYRYGISFNKLFEAMAARRPVVFACTSAYDPVARDGAGVSVAPDDPESMADAFLTLADAGLKARVAMGAAGRHTVELDHNMAALAVRLDAVLPA
jgi:glycosyltransferase involved in cell wall biosynthesis